MVEEISGISPLPKPGVIWLLVSRLSSGTAMFLATSILARVFGDSEFGFLSFILLTSTFLTEIVDLGFSRIIIRDLGVVHEKRKYLGSVLLIKICFASIIAITAVIWANHPWQDNTSWGYLALGIGVLSGSLWTTAYYTAQSIGNWFAVFLIDIGRNFVVFICALTVFLFAFPRSYFWTYISLGQIILGIIFLFWMWRKIGFAIPDKTILKTLLFEAAVIGTATLVGSLCNKIDFYVLYHYLPKVDFGHFSAAYWLYYLIFNIPFIWMMGWSPMISASSIKKRTESIWVTMFFFILSSIFLTGIWLYEGNALTLLIFGPEFSMIRVFMILFSILLPIHGAVVYLDAIMIIQKRSECVLVLMVVTLIVYIVGNIAGVSYFGIWTAFIMRFIVEGLSLMTRIFFLREQIYKYKLVYSADLLELIFIATLFFIIMAMCDLYKSFILIPLLVLFLCVVGIRSYRRYTSFVGEVLSEKS